MLRNMDLVYFLFVSMIESNGHVTTHDDILASVNGQVKDGEFSRDHIMYHLNLMKGKEWVELFTDGARMTWDGHDYFDSEYITDDSEVDKTTGPEVDLTIVE